MEHPLKTFQYCPVCGSHEFEENNIKSKRCRSCGFVYYANACSATVAFIVRSKNGQGKPDELLVARRGKEPAKGTLDIVGGFVDMEESAEEGLLREITEETGMTVTMEDVRYLFSIPNLYEYSGMTIHTLDMFYLVRVDADAEPHAHDDVAELQWIPFNKVDPSLFGLRSISQGVRRFIAERERFLRGEK